MYQNKYSHWNVEKLQFFRHLHFNKKHFRTKQSIKTRGSQSKHEKRVKLAFISLKYIVSMDASSYLHEVLSIVSCIT